MANIEYNKTYMIQIGKDLAVRRSALPVLQNKESALRAEALRIRNRLKALDERISRQLHDVEPLTRLWPEFPDMVRVRRVQLGQKKIAGIAVPFVQEVVFDETPFHPLAHPAWFLPGQEIIKQVIRLYAERLAEEQVLAAVEYARRKTTQKVNLYEKVQIPFFEESIRKIKRFLEDEENLSKSSQKVLKNRIAASVAS